MGPGGHRVGRCVYMVLMSPQRNLRNLQVRGCRSYFTDKAREAHSSAPTAVRRPLSWRLGPRVVTVPRCPLCLTLSPFTPNCLPAQPFLQFSDEQTPPEGMRWGLD